MYHKHNPGLCLKNENIFFVFFFRLINKLLKADGKSAIQFQKKVMSPFVAMTNIENFNKGCLDYGLSKEFTFQSGDLWEVRKGPFLNVLNGIHSLGFVVSINPYTQIPLTTFNLLSLYRVSVTNAYSRPHS